MVEWGCGQAYAQQLLFVVEFMTGGIAQQVFMGLVDWFWESCGARGMKNCHAAIIFLDVVTRLANTAREHFAIDLQRQV